MTKSEYAAIRELYLKLMEKENRTKREEAQYNYCDAIITYAMLKHEAMCCGNKNPDENFLVKNARERMDVAQKKLRDIV